MSIYTLTTLLPFVAVLMTVMAIVFLTLGVRGRPVFSSPRCAKCAYDLRNMQFMSSDVGNCPECGNRLAETGAVTFGRWQRQPRRIVLGVVLLLLPWAAGFALFVGMRSQAVTRAAGVGMQAKAAMTTPALLASLKTTVDSPWDWQELERRMRVGQLSQADADAAVGVLIADLNVKRAAGKERQPLHWADRFISPAINRNVISQPKVLALAQAYYGTDPKFTLRTRAREGDPIQLTLNEHEAWNLPNMQQVWSLTSIIADGTTPLAPQLRYPTYTNRRQQDSPPALKPDELSGNGRSGEMHLVVPQSLPPGEHELAFTFEMGVLPENVTMRGLDGKPGTPEKWPNPVARWQSVVKRKITVRPKEQSPINLVSDPARDPFKAASVAVEEALVRPSSKGVELVLKFKYTGVFSPAVGYRIRVQAGGQKIDYGTMVAGQTPRGGTRGATSHVTVKELPADVRKIDILFEPDPTVVEQHHTAIEEIWGKPHRIDDVPLQRFDLGDGRPPGDAAGAQDKPPTAQAG